MLRWLRRRREAERLARADAEALSAPWRRALWAQLGTARVTVCCRAGTTYAAGTLAPRALIVGETGHEVGLDAATRIAKDGDYQETAGRTYLDPGRTSRA